MGSDLRIFMLIPLVRRSFQEADVYLESPLTFGLEIWRLVGAYSECDWVSLAAQLAEKVQGGLFFQFRLQMIIDF